MHFQLPDKSRHSQQPMPELTQPDIERAMAIPAALQHAIVRVGVTCPACGSDSYSTAETRKRVGCIYHRWECNVCDHRWSGHTRSDADGDSKELPDEAILLLAFREALKKCGLKIVRDDA